MGIVYAYLGGKPAQKQGFFLILEQFSRVAGGKKVTVLFWGFKCSYFYPSKRFCIIQADKFDF